MILRVFWASILIIAALSFWGMFSEIVPDLKEQREKFHRLVDIGIPGKGTLQQKLERSVRRGFNDNLAEYYGVVVLKVDEKEYAKSFQFLRGPDVRDHWLELHEGDSIPVIYLKEDPSQFYAPSFLEFGEKSAGPNSKYWFYVGLAVISGILWIFAFAKLVIWPRPQGR